VSSSSTFVVDSEAPGPRPTRYRGVVLLADDEDAFRESLEELLEAQDYLVLPARSGAEALARIRGLAGAAVAIIDLVMPGMDGRGLIRAMQADEELRQIPIIVLSAEQAESIPGAQIALRKPCKPKVLFAAVDALLRDG
jgi:CheY-like chemotaxis protein